MPKTITISLPESLQAFIEQQLKQGRHSSASEFICHLVRQEMRRVDEMNLHRMLHDGAMSGTPIRADSKYWERMQARVERRARTNGSGGQSQAHDKGTGL